MVTSWSSFVGRAHGIGFLGLCALVVSVGCVPEPLGDPASDNNGMQQPPTDTGGTTIPPVDTNNNNTGGGESDFPAVASIIKANCLLGGCHGNPSGPVAEFAVANGNIATDQEIYDVLMSDIPTPSGNLLIAAGSPDTSEVYLRITKPVGDPLLMGKGSYGAVATPLDAPDISTIQAWIAAGATF